MTHFKAVKVCAICGGDATTDDHIAPQSLYPRPRRPNLQLHSVPACERCNNGASSDDEEFKMIIGITTAEVQENSEAVVSSLQRTMSANKRSDAIIRSGKRTISFDRVSSNGNYLVQDQVKVPFEGSSYSKVVERMIRGLYWRQNNRPLGIDTKVQVFDPNDFPPDIGHALRDLLFDLPRNVLNDETFCYKVGFSSDGSSVWGSTVFWKAYRIRECFPTVTKFYDGKVNYV